MPSTPAAGQALETAARRLFREKGYEGAHVTAIAERAGVSVATFYLHLDSKERAYERVMGAPPPVNDGEEPRSDRGRKTRAALVAAAQRCFVRDGYNGARIRDIASMARTSMASFYSYFDSKRAVLEAVMNAVADELRVWSAATEGAQSRSRGASIETRIRRVIEHYFLNYERYARLVLRIDEAVAVHPDMMPLRLAVHASFAARITRSLARWQADGLADPALDASHAGDALAAMVGHSARVWLTFGQKHDRKVAIDTLVRLWVQSVQATNVTVTKERP